MCIRDRSDFLPWIFQTVSQTPASSYPVRDRSTPEVFLFLKKGRNPFWIFLSFHAMPASVFSRIYVLPPLFLPPKSIIDVQGRNTLYNKTGYDTHTQSYIYTTASMYIQLYFIS